MHLQSRRQALHREGQPAVTTNHLNALSHPHQIYLQESRELSHLNHVYHPSSSRDLSHLFRDPTPAALSSSSNSYLEGRHLDHSQDLYVDHPHRRLLLNEFSHHTTSTHFSPQEKSALFNPGYLCQNTDNRSYENDYLTLDEFLWKEKLEIYSERQEWTPADTLSGIPIGNAFAQLELGELPSPIHRIQDYLDFYRRLEVVSEARSPLPQNRLPSPLQNPFVPSRSPFGTGFKHQGEKTFAELLGTSTLLSPLVELPTIEEDISCELATINLLEPLAAFRDLFPVLPELPPSSAATPPSTLLEVEEPVDFRRNQNRNPEVFVRVIDNSFNRQPWSEPAAVAEPLTKRIKRT